MIKNTLKTFEGLTVSLLFLPAVSFAADIKIMNPFTGAPTNAGTISLSSLINQFYSFALMAAGILAMGAIIYGAILYTVSSGSESKKSDAKQWITQAILGMMLLLAAYLILNTINTNIVTNLSGTITPATLNGNLATSVAATAFQKAISDCRNRYNANLTICGSGTGNLITDQQYGKFDKTGVANYFEGCSNPPYIATCGQCAASVQGSCEIGAAATKTNSK